jgi:hypothetical protein
MRTRELSLLVVALAPVFMAGCTAHIGVLGHGRTSTMIHPTNNIAGTYFVARAGNHLRGRAEYIEGCYLVPTTEDCSFRPRNYFFFRGRNRGNILVQFYQMSCVDQLFAQNLPTGTVIDIKPCYMGYVPIPFSSYQHGGSYPHYRWDSDFLMIHGFEEVEYPPNSPTLMEIPIPSAPPPAPPPTMTPIPQPEGTRTRPQPIGSGPRVSAYRHW